MINYSVFRIEFLSGLGLGIEFINLFGPENRVQLYFDGVVMELGKVLQVLPCLHRFSSVMTKQASGSLARLLE